MQPHIHDFLTAFSGCNGGQIGSPEQPSIWVCGIEWGGGFERDEDLLRYIHAREEWENPPTGEENLYLLDYPYGRTTVKLLTAIDGGKVEEYEGYFEQYKQARENAEKGIFLLNLYPLAFKDTDSAHWKASYHEILGFRDKGEYIRWCRRYRFIEMNKRANQYKPKLVICYGLNYADDFNTAFSDGYRSFEETQIDGLRVCWKRNENGTVVAVLPFPNIPNGLLRNTSLQQIGEFLENLLA